MSVASAQAQAPSVDKYFFSCSGAVKVQNFVAAVQPAAWTKVPPSRSFNQGGGCGFADVLERPVNMPENPYDAFYSGLHTQAVAGAKIELYNLLTSRARTGATMPVLVVLSSGTGSDYRQLAAQRFVAKPSASSTGVSEKIVVEFTNLKIPASAGRILTITVSVDTVGAYVWVHDAIEVPANVTFTGPLPL